MLLVLGHIDTWDMVRVNLLGLIRFDSFRHHAFCSTRSDSIRYDSARFDSVRFDSFLFDSLHLDEVWLDLSGAGLSQFDLVPFGVIVRFAI